MIYWYIGFIAQLIILLSSTYIVFFINNIKTISDKTRNYNLLSIGFSLIIFSSLLKILELYGIKYGAVIFLGQLLFILGLYSIMLIYYHYNEILLSVGLIIISLMTWHLTTDIISYYLMVGLVIILLSMAIYSKQENNDYCHGTFCIINGLLIITVGSLTSYLTLIQKELIVITWAVQSIGFLKLYMTIKRFR